MKLQFHHHLEQLQSENISKRATLQMCKWNPLVAQPAPTWGTIHLCAVVTRQSKYHPVLPVSGLVQPPKLSPECGEMLCSANSGANRGHMSQISGHTCQPKPWPCMHLPPSEFNTQLPPVAPRAHLQRRSLGTLVLQVTLNSIIYLTASTDSCEYRLCARH